MVDTYLSRTDGNQKTHIPEHFDATTLSTAKILPGKRHAQLLAQMHFILFGYLLLLLLRGWRFVYNLTLSVD